jgi:hypothetical protein
MRDTYYYALWLDSRGQVKGASAGSTETGAIDGARGQWAKWACADCTDEDDCVGPVICSHAAYERAVEILLADK